MINVIQAAEADLPIIQTIAHQTWPSTFGEILSSDQISYMLNMMYSLESLNTQMTEKNHVFLLAQEDTSKAYLGYISYELNCKDQPTTKIHKIYLLPASQGMGVGRLLIHWVEREARKARNNRLSLNVNRFNKAIQFYEKLNFAIVGRENIDIGNGFLMEDFIMEKPLMLL